MGLQESSLQNFDIGNSKIVQDSGNEKAVIAIKNRQYESIKKEYEKNIKELSKQFFDLEGSYIDSLDEKTLQGFKNIISWKARRRLLFPLAFDFTAVLVMILYLSFGSNFGIFYFSILMPFMVANQIFSYLFNHEFHFYFTEKKFKKLDCQT